MILAQVKGSVVSTSKNEKLVGYKFMIVQPIEDNKLMDKFFVAVDAIGAGIGEKVLVATGSAARLAITNVDAPVDAAIVGIVDEKTIDEINILNATKLGVKIALEGLKQRPDVIMVDALNNMDTLGIPYISVVKGDAKNYSIAAASIIAKVTRDRIMKEWDEIYPIYGFSKHKGYGTAEHIRIIKENGPCILHRKSFIKNFV